MKLIHLGLVALSALFCFACGGQSEKQESQKDSVAENNLFIGETEADAALADTLLFKSFPDAVASIASEDDVYGVWSHEVGDEIKTYYLIYRHDGMYWFRNVRVDGKKFRLEDEKQSIQLKYINSLEFQDMQNGGGYRLTDSTLVVYDAQNYAEELGRKVFDWKD